MSQIARRLRRVGEASHEVVLVARFFMEWFVPTVNGIAGPHRFFFYSFDCNEPPHIHVRRDKAVCKFWIEPISLASNSGFKPKELNQIRKQIIDNLDRIREAWNEHCDQ